jgi:hypothetical protein
MARDGRRPKTKWEIQADITQPDASIAKMHSASSCVVEMRARTSPSVLTSPRA